MIDIILSWFSRERIFITNPLFFQNPNIFSANGRIATNPFLRRLKDVNDDENTNRILKIFASLEDDWTKD